MDNPFSSQDTAALYARGRPDHHERTVQHLAALLPPGTAIGAALDVGCGTGPSTRALRGLARDVVGVDAATAMVELAATSDDAVVIAARAEALPVRDSTFELVVVASAVHWFHEDVFVGEARRVLTPRGLVAVTEHFFLGQMEGVESFAGWMRDVYARRYPTPARGRHLSVVDDVPVGLEVAGKDGWLDPITMTRDQLADYLLTQSNTVAAVDSGQEERQSIGRWLRDELEQFFPDGEPRVLRFWGSAVCYRVAS